MKILQIASADLLGGGEVHVLQLTAKLREHGHDVLLAGREGGPLKPDYSLPFRNALDLPTAWRLRRIVSNERFQIVHAHIARDYPIAATALMGLQGPRLVLTRQLIFPVKRHPFYRRVDGWIVTTDQILRSIQPHAPRDAVIVPNWVDAARMAYREREPGEPVVLGLLGQVSPHKGHDDAIAAMRELGDGFRLLVGGQGRPEYEAQLKSDAAGLGVEFLGFVHSGDFLSKIDCLILPSWEEPFGIVVLEAMAAGVNVIATDTGGPPEILEYGAAGLLVPPRDPGALAGAVRKLAGDPELRARLRQRAIERIRDRYDINLTVPRIEAFYRRLASAN